MGVFLGDYSIHGKRPSVEEELAKHGSHNQKTHGGKGGSGGSGGGSAPNGNDTSNGRDDKLVDKLADDVDELKNELDEYYNDIEDGDPDDEIIGRVSDSMDAATQNMEYAMDAKDIDRHSATMDTAEGHLRDAASAASYGSNELQDSFKRPLERLADSVNNYLDTLDDD